MIDSLEPNMNCWEQIIAHNKQNETVKDYLISITTKTTFNLPSENTNILYIDET